MRPTKRDAASVGGRCGVGFTLVELLVVVSIIALMMSITLPALTRAQRQGEGVHCLGNERQLTLAWIQYAMDNQDYLCPPEDFARRLEPYAPMREVFVCKAIQDEGAPDSYGISNAMGGQYRDGVTPNEKLHKIAFASEKMVFVDVEPDSRGCFWPILREKDAWFWRPWSWPSFGDLQSTTARHNDGCNMSFADGHCEYTRWKDSRTLKLIKGLIADPKEASSDNEDLKRLIAILTR
jgi:prepilin-type processing-associated H-X9-DG protein/prepilin-type N-terminal cleavage/methylation domain-containing protein